MVETQCIACGSSTWLKLPDPSAGKSVTTAGSIVNEPLAKSQCAECGFIQRTEYRYLGSTDFYENRYATYYERVGTETFNRERYAHMAQWVSAAIGDFKPGSVVEVGCGRGWTLGEMKALYPHAIIEGIEPSVANSREARERGIQVYTGKLDLNNIPGSRYDLVFSNHVLQHTTDPIGFLKAMGEIASDRGLIVVTIQNASVASNELMYSDQNFSFLPTHLVGLAERAGLRVLSWRSAQDNDSLKFSQLLVCCKQAHKGIDLPGDLLPETSKTSLESLYSRRVQYIESWSKINEYLLWRTSKNRNVFNFGAGMYGYLLACYCEEYWKRVKACVVDGFNGEFLGKRVMPFEELRLGEMDCLVIGTRPGIQRMIASRFKDHGIETICWDNFIEG